MKIPKLLISEIGDRLIQENFSRLVTFLENEPILNAEWRMVQLSFSANLTDYAYAHKLSFAPTDIIVTSTIGTGSISFNYAKFDKTNVYLTTSGVSGSFVVRFLMGRI